jgi:hypothetical protein
MSTVIRHNFVFAILPAFVFLVVILREAEDLLLSLSLSLSLFLSLSLHLRLHLHLHLLVILSAAKNPCISPEAPAIPRKSPKTLSSPQPTHLHHSKPHPSAH